MPPVTFESFAILRFVAIINAAFALALVVIFLGWPAVESARVLHSGVLASPEVPAFTHRWHKNLSKEFAPWADERVRSGRATTERLSDVAGTEWPMFSAVFYLWGTEALQRDAVDRDVAAADQPMVYARDAIRAAVKLIVDPGHATWVRKYWGDAYLERENLFYRMLLINGLVSYQSLSGDTEFEYLLREQVTSLAAEFDASPHGLIDDYPGESYPIDILPALAAIKRADPLLGTDHTQMLNRSVRGFEGNGLDASTGLPAYLTDAQKGNGVSSARGVGIAFMSLWAMELWPDVAARWYAGLEEHFWQQGRWISGFREYPRHVSMPAFSVDVDAGPVIYGLGTSACAFGIGAARTQGRFDHAYPLGAQAFATMFPTVGGRLLVPRALSKLADAPFTGEAIMLFMFTRQPADGVVLVPPASGPPAGGVLFLGLLGLLSVLLLGLVTGRLCRVWPAYERATVMPRWQLGLWLVVMGSGAILVSSGSAAAGVASMLLGQLLPR
ncbi:MAG: hypothetical protein AB8G16_18115 [Gammaproteobacteria bacterium]